MTTNEITAFKLINCIKHEQLAK